jgi:hypothetical protein
VEPSAVSNHLTADLAVTFAAERSQATADQGGFWFKGGGVDAGVTVWKDLGIAASLTGDHASGIAPSVDANKITYLLGPRYNYTPGRRNVGTANERRTQLFVQTLFGGVHGFDGLYPTNNTTTSRASAFALQAGGGVNLYLTKRFGLRLLEADYVRTNLPNGAANAQNDLRLGFGVTCHMNSVRLW